MSDIPESAENEDERRQSTLDELAAVLARSLVGLLDRVKALESKTAALQKISDAQQVLGILAGVHRDLIVDLFKKLGLNEMEGLPIGEWWKVATRQHLQTVLITFEDKDPGAAAFLQSLVDGTLGEEKEEQ
jgi:hypothetical protein